MSASDTVCSGAQDQNRRVPHVVLVGGGMVGASLALLLAKQLPHVAITLIEQHPFPEVLPPASFQPSFDDRSTALSAASLDILHTMGCWSPLQAVAQPIVNVHVSDSGHFGGTLLQAADYDLTALGYVIENRLLGQVLLAQLRETRVRCLAPAQVAACMPVAGGYELKLENIDQVMHADLLVIADGAQSGLRQSLGIGVRETDYRQSALIANVALKRAHQGIAYERFTNEGPVALLPLPAVDGRDRAALVLTLPAASTDAFTEMSDAALLEQLQMRLGHRAGRLTAIGERFIYPLKLIEADEQVRSHLVVMGNAAHSLHPVAGQGFNLALRDCQTLVSCLCQPQNQTAAFGALSVLVQYIDHQSGDQQLTIGLTDRLVRLFSTQQLPLVILRQLGLLSLTAVSPARHQFARIMMGMR